MSEKATIIRRLEAAYAHALDETEKAIERRDATDGAWEQIQAEEEVAHLRGHVAGLKQALNLCKEPT